ncbi:MAG: heavy-metal-associated domain-containing protein [Betaproteobacteria bacterium]|jgi:Cu+-exporting ATPase|nr:heavy-metal-associated domain-containing protein [Betaproteobacteria bacterium]
MKKLIIAFMLIFATTVFADEKKLTVKIDGMTCPSCAASVENQFEKLDAVNSVDISLTKGIAIVTLKEGKDLNENDVKNAVKNAGFKAIEVSGLN